MEAREALPVFGPSVMLERLSKAGWPARWRLAGARSSASVGARCARPVVLELATDERTVSIEVAHRGDRDRAFAYVGELAISYWPPARADDGAVLCRAVAAALAPDGARFAFLAPAEIAAPSPASGWAAGAPAGELAGVRSLEPGERRALEPLIEAYPHFHDGQSLTLRRLGDGGVTVTFPAPATPEHTFLLAPRRFASNSHLRAYFEGLGYAWDADGRVRTVPTPATFSRRAQAHLGFRPRLRQGRWRTVRARVWLDHLCAGELPINVGARSVFGVLRPLRTAALARSPRVREFTSPLFHALGHDMSTHVLLLHRISPAHAADMGRAIRAACEPLALRSGPFAPLPLLRFYENDLTRACRDIWVELDRPEDFAAAFEGRLPQILDRMAARIEAIRLRRLRRLYFDGAAWLE